MRTLSVLAVAAMLLAACDQSSAHRMWNRIEAENAAANPPQLWSAQALPARADAPPVKVCTDAALREGFRSLTPQVGGESCTRTGEGAKTANGSAFRCTTPSGASYGVSIAITGDPETAFTAASAIHPLQAGGGDLSQTIRYIKLGPCPAGWAVGDATDRTGRRVSALAH